MGLATPVFSTMYVISTSLLYPVIVVLIGLVGWSIVMLGAFLSEYTTRHRSMEELDRVAMKAREALSKGDVEGAASTLESVEAAPFVREFLQKLAASMRQGAQRKTEKLMDDYELMTMGILEKTVLGAKVGPMVGRKCGADGYQPHHRICHHGSGAGGWNRVLHHHTREEKVVCTGYERHRVRGRCAGGVIYAKEENSRDGAGGARPHEQCCQPV